MGKVRKLPVLTLNSTPIDKVDKYTYLGVVFTYNAKFNASISERIDKGTKAMFSLLRKGREHDIPHDIMLHLFDSSVAPVLMYGSEIWGCSDVQRFEPHLGHNWLSCGVFLVKSSTFGSLWHKPQGPNWQSLLAGGSVVIQTWSIYKICT